MNIDNDCHDFSSVEAKLSGRKPNDIQVGVGLTKSFVTLEFPRAKKKREYKGFFFGTVVEVEYNLKGKPTKIFVERDNGQRETWTEKSEPELLVKEAVMSPSSSVLQAS